MRGMAFFLTATGRIGRFAASRPHTATLLPPPLLMALALSSSTVLLGVTPQWREIHALLVLAAAGLAVRGGGAVQDALRAGPLLALLVVPPVLSLAANGHAPATLAGLSVVAAYAFVGARWRSEAALRALLVTAAIASAACALYILGEAVAVKGPASYWKTRDLGFSPQLSHNHNYVGLLALCAAVGSLGFRRRAAGYGMAVGALVLAVAVTSRGAALAILVGLSVRLATEPGLAEALCRRRRLLLAAGMGLVALAIAFHGLVVDAASDMLLLASERRGMNTGFSHRSDLWVIAWYHWEAHAWFGKGWGVDLFDPHNAVLEVAVRTGAVGIAGYVVFNVVCLRRTVAGFRSPDRFAAMAALVTVASYTVYGIFESRAVSAGNPLSALFLILAFAAASRPPDRVLQHAP